MKCQFRSVSSTGAKDYLDIVAKCRYCDQIRTSAGDKVYIHCTKLSGSPHPIHVNLNTCLSCPEFRQTTMQHSEAQSSLPG